MGQTDLSNFKGLYIQTARDYLKQLRTDLEKLSKNSKDLEAIISVHISAHSLATQSTITGYKNIEDLCRLIENSFKKLKEEKAGVPDSLLKILKDSIIVISKSIDSIEKTDKEIDLSAVINKYKEL